VEFGPVEKQGLLLWAEQARILPGHEVSTDRKNWEPAVTVDFPDMCWFIDEGDGDLKGPLNHKAAETLVKNGKFSANSRIVSAAELSEEGEKNENAEETAAAVPEDKPLADVSVQPEKVAVKVPEKAVPSTSGGSSVQAKHQERQEEKVTGPHRTVIPEKVAESNALRTLREESQKTITTLNKKVRDLEQRLKESETERRQMNASTVSGDVYQNLKKESDALQRDYISAQKKVEALQHELQNRDNLIEKLERQLNEKSVLQAESERKVQEAVHARERALQQSRESERSFARLLSDANKRDNEYKAKIEALKKNIVLSPDQTDRFYSDQNAIYQILKRELESITKTMESERGYLDSLKGLGVERLKELEKLRQSLQNHLGNSPGEMTNRVLREQTSDPNAVRIRTELDNLKIAHERATHKFEERERDLNHKLKVVQADYTNLMNQLLEKERETESLQILKEQLAASEHDRVELRKSYEAERRQFVANNNALAARVVELEGGATGSSPGEVQAAEAKGVRLASWMTFRK